MCTVLLPPGDNPIAVNKYIVSYHIISYHIILYHIISYHIISYHIIIQIWWPYLEQIETYNTVASVLEISDWKIWTTEFTTLYRKGMASYYKCCVSLVLNKLLN